MKTLLIRAGIALALLIAVFFAGCHTGADHVQAKWDKDHAAQTAALNAEKARASQVTTRVVTEYVDRIKVVREKARTIVKEVPVYVTPEADSACVVPRGFVRVHDGAAANLPPGAPEATDDAPSGVALSAVAEITAENYGTYHEVAAQLKALQDWVRQQYGEGADGQVRPH